MATTTLRVIVDTDANGAIAGIRAVGTATQQASKDAQQSGKAQDDAASQSASAWSRAAGAIGNVMSGIGRAAAVTTQAIAVGWTAAAGAAAGFAVSAFKTGVEFNTLNQKANAAFTTILGSADAASKMMSDITAFAKTSPFPRQAYITAAQQMSAFGFSADKVIPTLKAVTDAVAASGGGAQQLSDVTFVLSKIQAAGKITAQDLMQLGQRGINAADLIGSQMGKTGAQIRDEITKGALPAGAALDALAAGMESRFGGAADKVKETWVGATDRVKGAIRDIGSAMAEPLISSTGGGMGVDWANQLADALRALVPIVQAAMGALKTEFGGTLSTVGQVLSSITTALKGVDLSSIGGAISNLLPMLGTLTGAFGAIAGGPFLKMIPGIGPMLAGLSGPVGILVSAIAGLVATSPALQNLFSGILQTAIAAVTPLLPTLQHALQMVTDALAAILGAVAPLIPMFLSLVTAALKPLLAVIPMILPPLESLVLQLMGPLVSIIAALTPFVAQLVGAFVLLIPPVVTIVQALMPPLIQVLNLVLAAVLPLLPVIAQLVTVLVQVAVSAVMPLLPPLMQLIDALLPLLPVILKLVGVLAQLVAAFAPLLSLIGQLVGIIVGALAGALSNLLTGALSKIAPLFDIISDALDWVIGKLQDFTAWLSKIKIPDWLKSAGSWVGNLFKSAPAPASFTMTRTFTTNAATGTLAGVNRLALPGPRASSAAPSTPTIAITVNAPFGGGDAIGRAIRKELSQLDRRRNGVNLGGPRGGVLVLP